MEGIQVSVERAGMNNNIAVIKVGGYIDTTTSAELEHALDSLLKAGMNRIIIDLGNVDYISSAGWGIFISEIKGIRERGGDLKLVRMIPDVYEVFELLEFHYILKAFDTLEEAVRDFDRGTSFEEKPQAKDVEPSGDAATMSAGAEPMVAEQKTTVSSADQRPRSIDDKIREVVINNPDAGTLKIKKLLASPQYGNVKIGFFELRRRLKELNLDSKSKRVEFFKQRAMSS
ncbi:MAG: STAS domain-containing protein [candidate division KSB1 bacterium]|nr:STAS domain-containing protein [candidate division KSB1 bacterium]MDQ7064620.1 STAS domain-containing protein [candidate division KSB1 bacterium]